MHENGMGDLAYTTAGIPWWAHAAVVLALLVAAVTVHAGIDARRRRHWYFVPSLMAVGVLAVVGIVGIVGITATGQENAAACNAAVIAAVQDAYGLSLTSEQAAELRWPAETPSWEDRDVAIYGTTEVLEEETVRTVQLVWNGAEFELRQLGEKPALPGTELGQ